MTLAASFGGLIDDVQALATKAPGYVHDALQLVTAGGQYLSVLVRVVDDPALPAVIDRIEKLIAIEDASSAKAPAAAAPAKATKGIGLQQAVMPLDLFIWYRQHPAAAVAIAAGGVLALVGAGYALGCRRARSRA